MKKIITINSNKRREKHNFINISNNKNLEYEVKTNPIKKSNYKLNLERPKNWGLSRRHIANTNPNYKLNLERPKDWGLSRRHKSQIKKYNPSILNITDNIQLILSGTTKNELKFDFISINKIKYSISYIYTGFKYPEFKQYIKQYIVEELIKEFNDYVEENQNIYENEDFHFQPSNNFNEFISKLNFQMNFENILNGIISIYPLNSYSWSNNMILFNLINNNFINSEKFELLKLFTNSTNSTNLNNLTVKALYELNKTPDYINHAYDLHDWLQDKKSCKIVLQDNTIKPHKNMWLRAIYNYKNIKCIKYKNKEFLVNQEHLNKLKY